MKKSIIAGLGSPRNQSAKRKIAITRKAETMCEDTEFDSIDRYRREIDEIDRELLRMLNRRASCALSIGKIKKKKNLPIHVPEREEQVLQRLTSINEGPVPAESVRNVFQIIFAQMRALEELGEDTG